jgi:solute:Na+ symporter, SSS family
MTDQVGVLAGLTLYFLAVLAIGVVAARKVKGTDDFVVAGRRLPLWLATGTLLATWMGAGTAMGAAGAAYEGGFLAVIADPFGAALCLILAGLFFVRVLRRMRLLTIIDFFASKYSPNLGLLAGLAMIAVYIGWTGSQLVAFGFVLHTMAGVDPSIGIIIATVIVLFYTAAGGMWAVALTDFFQIVLLALGFIIILPLAISAGGGWEQISGRIPEGSFRIVPVEGDAITWMHYVRAWAVVGLGGLAGQDLMQRTLSSKNENVAQNACYLAGIGYLTVGMIPVLLGIVGAVLIPDLANPEFIVPELALRYLSVVPLTIFIGALLLAIMSSADSAILAPASIFGENVVKRFAPHLSRRAILTWIRWSIPVIGFAALGIALHAQNVYALFLDSFTILLVALFVPLTAGIWWERANRSGAAASMVVGVAVWLGGKPILPDLPTDLLGVLAAAVAMVAVSLATQRSDPPRPLLTHEGRPISPGEGLGTLNPFDRKGRTADDSVDPRDGAPGQGR